MTIKYSENYGYNFRDASLKEIRDHFYGKMENSYDFSCFINAMIEAGYYSGRFEGDWLSIMECEDEFPSFMWNNARAFEAYAKDRDNLEELFAWIVHQIIKNGIV